MDPLQHQALADYI